MPPRAALAASLLALSFTAPAWAQPARDARRRTLLQQAAEARRGNDHDRAVDLAREALTLGSTPANQLFLAEELNALGRLGEALDAARQCVSEADEAPRAPGNARTAERCRALTEELQGRAARVRIRPSGALPRLHVWVGDAEVPRATWSEGCYVPSGRVMLEASAPGHRTLRRPLNLTAGDTTTIEVSLDPEESAPAQRPQGPNSGSSGGSDRGSTVSAGPGAWPWVVLGLGVASLGASAVFRFALYANETDQRDQLCPGGRCANQEAYLASVPHVESAGNWALASNLALGIGATAVVTGVLWAVVGRSRSGTTSSASSPRATLDVRPLTGGAALSLGGAF